MLLLSFAGFDVVTLANNHLNDFGSEGVNFSVDVLKKTGVKFFGVSYSKYDSSQVQSLVDLRIFEAMCRRRELRREADVLLSN